MSRYLTILAGVALAALAIAAPASAAPPANDTFAGATTISALPFSDTLDPREATTDAVDTEAMTVCGLPYTAETSVWYAFTPTSNTDVTLDSSGSDYWPDINILSGSPGSLNCVSGGSQGGLVFRALAGQTYHMQVFEVGTPGSTLQLSVSGQPRLPPANDAFAGATKISALPFSDTLDTREATTDAVDGEVETTCGYFAEATVWYAFTPSSDIAVTVDTSGSDYFAYVNILSGGPGGFQCLGGAGSSFLALAGQTYYFQVYDGWTHGSTLRLTVLGHPAPHATLTVDPTAKTNKQTGVATVTGTFTCSNLENGASVGVQLTQPVGRFLISGFATADVRPCDGLSHPWSVNVPGNGKFGGGPAHVDASIGGCNAYTCGGNSASLKIRLR
jgi:hypothetical protein